MAKQKTVEDAIQQASPKEEVIDSKNNKAVISMSFDQVKEEELKQMAEEYDGLVVTKDTNSFNAGKLARKTIRDERYAIQNILKEKKSTLNDVKKKLEDKAQYYIDIILPTEEHIDKQIKEIEEEKQREKEEKERLEKERKDKLQQASIDFVEGFRARIREAKTEKEVKGIATEIANTEYPDFEDFQNNVYLQMDNVANVEIPNRIQQIQDEKELEELRKQKKEWERQQKEEAQKKVSSEDVPESQGSVTVSNGNITDTTDVFTPDKDWMIEKAESISISALDVDRLDINSKQYILISTVKEKLEEVKKYMLSEIDKIYGKQ